jgi:ribosomal protein S14
MKIAAKTTRETPKQSRFASQLERCGTESDAARFYQLRICRRALRRISREVGASIADGRIRYREDIVDVWRRLPKPS